VVEDVLVGAEAVIQPEDVDGGLEAVGAGVGVVETCINATLNTFAPVPGSGLPGTTVMG